MKSSILSIAFVTLPACWSWGLTSQPVVVSSDLTFASDYVFRGIKFADESFQPTLEASVGDFYAGIWANLPTKRQDTEINYYGGIGFDAPNVDFVSFDAGVTVYHFPDTGSDRTHEFYLGGNFSFAEIPPLTASLYYMYDVDIHSHVGESSFTYSQTLERLGLPASLDFTVTGGIQGGGEVETESYNYYGGSIKLPFALNEFALLTAGVHYATAEKLNFGPGQRGDNLFWTLSYATSF